MSKADKLESNSRVYKMIKRSYDLVCSFCKPNKGENSKKNTKYGSRKPKYKDKR